MNETPKFKCTPKWEVLHKELANEPAYTTFTKLNDAQFGFAIELIKSRVGPDESRILNLTALTLGYSFVFEPLDSFEKAQGLTNDQLKNLLANSIGFGFGYYHKHLPKHCMHFLNSILHPLS